MGGGGGYGSEWIKIYSIGLGEFMETESACTLVLKRYLGCLIGEWYDTYFNVLL